MPRYYFHQRNRDGSYVRDEEGSEHPNLQSAREEAIAGAREIMSGRVRAGNAADGSIFEITNESGEIVLKMPFKEAISSEDADAADDLNRPRHSL